MYLTFFYVRSRIYNFLNKIVIEKLENKIFFDNESFGYNNLDGKKLKSTFRDVDNVEIIKNNCTRLLVIINIYIKVQKIVIAPLCKLNL